MPISRGSIYHNIAGDFLAVCSTYLNPRTCEKPLPTERQSAQKSIANYFGSKHSILFPYARTCFFALLQSLDLEPGSEVLLTPFNISPMLHVIYSLGLKPRFIDINLSDFGPSYIQLEEALSQKPACFLLTYLFGSIPDLGLISDLCRSYNVPLIEDISQAIGGSFRGQAVGTFGFASIYSASITKYVDAYNGAFILTDNDALIKRLTASASRLIAPSKKRIRSIILKTLIWNIALSRHSFSLITFPLLRLLKLVARQAFESLLGPSIKTDLDRPLPSFYFEDITRIQVATMLSQLIKLKPLLRVRKQAASLMLQAVSSQGNPLVLPESLTYTDIESSVFWQFVIFVGSTARARNSLFAAGVETGITNLPDLSSMCGIKLENANRLKTQFIFLPLHPHLRIGAYKQMLRVVS